MRSGRGPAACGCIPTVVFTHSSIVLDSIDYKEYAVRGPYTADFGLQRAEGAHRNHRNRRYSTNTNMRISEYL